MESSFNSGLDCSKEPKLDSDGWDSLPKNYPWKFMSLKDPVGLVPIESPDQIDQIVETLTNLKSQTGLTLTRSKAIYKYFQSKRVLDPFVRRGDTALGAMAAGIKLTMGLLTRIFQYLILDMTLIELIF